jgi:hypothetical protein
MKDERYIEIDTGTFSYKGMMTQSELLREATKRRILSSDVIIGGYVMYGWDEINIMWAMSKNEVVV